MQIRVKGDSVEIEGYVNAVERKSRPLMSRMGQFIERICKGAFKKALERNDNVRILLNHDPNRDLGGTKDGNLELTEDNIGLHARAVITDKEVVEKARNGDLVGWSFGFFDRDVEQKRDEDGFPLRDVHDLDLEEVSILDRTKTPAYDGTLVAVRSEENSIFYGETFSDEIHIREIEDVGQVDKTENTENDEKTEIDYSFYEHVIEDMKQRYNDVHGKDGRFGSKGGSSGGGSSSGGSGGNWGYKGFHEQADKLTDAIKKANTPKRIQEISLSAKKLIKSIDKELENPEGNVARLKGAKYKAEKVIKEAEKKF